MEKNKARLIEIKTRLNNSFKVCKLCSSVNLTRLRCCHNCGHKMFLEGEKEVLFKVNYLYNRYSSHMDNIDELNNLEIEVQ